MANNRNNFYYTTVKLPKEWREDLKLIAIKENKNLNDILNSFINLGYKYYQSKNGIPTLAPAQKPQETPQQPQQTEEEWA